MNRQEAQEILFLYRPGTADAEDADFAEALQFCETDPELKQWFENHRAVYAALRARFRQSPVPEGLKEQILAERIIHTPVLRRRPVLAAAALLAVLALATPLWIQHRQKTQASEFVDRLVSTALRGYSMDLATNDPDQIRAWLKQQSAPSDYVVPASLQKAALTGCAIQSWQGAPMSMICFSSGTSQIAGQLNDLWLFVADRASTSGAPDTSNPSVTRVNRTTTARWSEGNKTYVLVADGDEAFIRKYL